MLGLQTPSYDPSVHDELQFIIVHQVYKLWFRLLIYKVRAIIAHLDLHQLCETMMEYDEQFCVWCARHALMAERLMGAKPGTGDTSTGRLMGGQSFQEPGVRYLQGRVGLRFFPILWEVRTRLGGGSYGG